MRFLAAKILGLVGAAALLGASPAWAACSGPSCGCSAISVPSWSPLPIGNAVADPPTVDSGSWFTESPVTTLTPEAYVAECAANIDSCVPSTVVVSTDAPPSGVSSWNNFNSLTPPSGYRTSNACYGYGTGPCNAVATPATNPNAPSGVTNYKYNTAFPCQMSQGGQAVAGSDAGAIKQFRMRRKESLSFAFTVPPVGSIPNTVMDTGEVDANGIPIVSVAYRSISFSDWNNPFVTQPVKFVTISQTSGDFDTIKAAANDPCYQSGVMGEIQYVIIDPVTYDSAYNYDGTLNNINLPPGVCPLKAGETYYINVRFQDPKNHLLTQISQVNADRSSLDAAYANLQAAEAALYAAMGIPATDPAVVAAQQNLANVIETAAGPMNEAAQNLYDATHASPVDPVAVNVAQTAYDRAKADYEAAVSAAQAQLDAAIAAAPVTSIPAPSDELAALSEAVKNAQDAYIAASNAYNAATASTVSFVQDTCEWSLCRSDQARSNISTPMEDTYANAYYKEWQCAHDLASVYTVPGLQAFCGMVSSGRGPPNCSWGWGDGDNCYPYTPVNPADCVGNRTASSSQNCSGDGDCSTVWTYNYTGGKPLKDCGVTIDMGCGLSVQ